MKIAVMPGDGIGKEVIAQGVRVLELASKKFSFKYETSDYPFGGEHYLKTRTTLPDSSLRELAQHDAILFGAVGVDPRGSAQIPQGIPRSGNPAEDALRAGPVRQPSSHETVARRAHAAEERDGG
jgi:isocitrate/isopropylmalate dehydrogenase